VRVEIEHVKDSIRYPVPASQRAVRSGPIETSVFAFATDLRDEGMETVLENVAGRAGAGGVTMAAAYHHGRDFFS
jgi:hypothetical protein